MKLATYNDHTGEHWGLVIEHPTTADLWVFNPEQVECVIDEHAEMPTSGYHTCRPCFGVNRPWPTELKDALALGQTGLDSLRRLQDFLLRFLEQSDQFAMAEAGRPLAEVQLRAPIPRPRIYWGLVGNSPSAMRNNPNRTIANLYPQGHARPQGAIIGHGQPMVVPKGAGNWGFNVELGVVIGRGGKYIPIDQAMEHVAGYTVVVDACSAAFAKITTDQVDPPHDFLEGATESWGGKKTDTMSPMGPYLVTKDEIGNVYDLLVYTRQSGWQRDRSSTAASLLGVERVIAWYTSFATLYPGDVMHMATMGVDGFACPEDRPFSPEDYVEVEIEKIGILRCPVVTLDHDDWRSGDDESRTIHHSPAVRDVLRLDNHGQVQREQWSPADARHFWRIYGNYSQAESLEDLKLRPYPRFLNGPASALAASSWQIELPPRATQITAGPELAFVVSQVTSQVSVEQAEAHILGYVAMVGLYDQSFRDAIIQPMTLEDKGMHAVYGRWADGFNVVSTLPTALTADQARNRTMTLDFPGWGRIESNTDEYCLGAPQVLSFISRFITLFPGDVITLGRTAAQLQLPHDRPIPPDATAQASIADIGTLDFTFNDIRDQPQPTDASLTG